MAWMQEWLLTRLDKYSYIKKVLYLVCYDITNVHTSAKFIFGNLAYNNAKTCQGSMMLSQSRRAVFKIESFLKTLKEI